MKLKTLIAAVIGLASLWCNAAETKRPNIVVILADDFGVGDIHALWPSNKLPTPNLDKLVQQGMNTLGLLRDFLRSRKRFFAVDHSRGVERYTAKTVARSNAET